MATLEQDLRELEGAEDFLDYFAIRYDPHVVEVNRLHILQRFHDYLARIALPPDEPGRREVHRNALCLAYQDFVSSDARTEKVFKVFRSQAGITYVSLDSLTQWKDNAPSI